MNDGDTISAHPCLVNPLSAPSHPFDSASNSKLITDKVAQAVATELEKVNTKMHQQYVDDTFSLINEIGKNLDIMVNSLLFVHGRAGGAVRCRAFLEGYREL